jgi:arginine decarboxylase
VSSTSSPRAAEPQAADGWTAADAEELYSVEGWSDGFFHVEDNGHLCVRPLHDDPLSIDVMKVIVEARQRNTGFPVLLRFQDILHARVRRLNEAFQEAIGEVGYGNTYRGVYPIKVNQLHEVVEEVLEAGRPFGVGLECGSKAELVAALPHLQSDDSLLICNGVKDSAMLSLIVAAQSLGQHVIPVMEKYGEFDQLMEIGAAQDIRPRFGVRIRLRTTGAGKWADSGGYRSKFGVSLPELLKIVERLELAGHLEGFEMLHFHLGSQISEIRQLRTAAKEMAQIYAELVQRGVEIRYLDVGGGVGVRYTGRSESGSINYSLQEYANAIVSVVKEVCDEREVSPPVLVSESGRAITAHHSMLVVEVLGAYRKDQAESERPLPEDAHHLVQTLYDTVRWLEGETGPDTPKAELIEAYHDVETAHAEASALFGLGYLPLRDNALVEQLYWSGCSAALRRLRALDEQPPSNEVRELEDKLIDQYLCNFSVFQSMLDHWAIGQSFPIMPLCRLHEPPTRRTMLVDLTCDSDGKISEYVSSRTESNYLELHELRPDEPYYLGAFLMGAYQDIMGDAHNLFGRVAEVHVYADADEPNNFWIEKIIPATDVKDMLAQVQYFPNDLRRRMQDIIKHKIESGVVRPKRGMDILDQYMSLFTTSTYLDTSANGMGSAG